MTKHFAPPPHDQPMAPPTPSQAPAAGPASTPSSAAVVNGVHGASAAANIDSTGLLFGGANSSHKKKKKKRTKKRTLERIEEMDRTAGYSSSSHHAAAHSHEHHADCHHDHTHQRHQHHDSGHHHHHHHEDEDEDDEDFYSDEDAYDPETPTFSTSTGAAALSGHAHEGPQTAPAAASNRTTDSGASKKKRKKRKKSSTTGAMPTISTNPHSHNHAHSSHAGSKTVVQSSHRNGHDHTSIVKHMHDNHAQNDGFWHYSDAEERQRIREFWFQLREEERRSLVRVEKEAVLKKMKEQQRHSCSCSLCGRKRTAIEEELELLYDAYYDELEQYANQQQPADGHALAYPQHSPGFEDDELSDVSRASDEDDEDEDDEDEEDEDEDGYEDEDDEDEYDDDVSNRKAAFPYRSGFPNTLQAKGNILTVAEDLLENDGKKFLEMMDRLADRKVQRDDDLMDNRGVYEEYDDDEEGEFEEDGPEEDALTKEQRMEEGRRMFQAFAARMFEQRVLSAYREKVAQERQERLLAELEEESRQEQLREERKEREKEKKRDKKRLQRQQKEEERAAKEAQRLAEEKRLLEERERKLEADRKRREEERRVKEEEKKAREEERLKKEEERKQKKAEQEAKRLERETFLKQQLAEEQRRQEELRQQEQLAKEELARQELEPEQRQPKELEQGQEQTKPSSSSPQQPAVASPARGRPVTADYDAPGRSQASQSRSPILASSASPSRGLAATGIPSHGQSSPIGNNLWPSGYPVQDVPQPQHAVSHQHQIFAQPMQQGLFRPPTQYGQMSGEQEAFHSRMGPGAGRGTYMAGSSHATQSSFQVMPQHQPSSAQRGGMRSPGLAPIGYGQGNSKQYLNLMNPSNAANGLDLTGSNGSPLHSPSTLGAIGTPISSFGPISPIGHARRTSTPHGSVSAEAIKPIQRPVPIGRPKDQQAGAGTISNSFDGISLGLSGLTIGSDIERRPRSPPLNLAGGSSLDLNGVVLNKDQSIRSANGPTESHGHTFSGENASATGSRQLDHSLPLLSPGGRGQSSFFSNSFFGNRMNGHDPFLQSADFSSFGQQPSSHGSLSSSNHFMNPYPMHLPSPPHNQQQQQSQQQQLFMQQQYLQELQLQQQLQQQQQQLGLGSPPLNGSSSWSRTNFMRPTHLNGLPGSNGHPSTVGMTSPTSSALSPPPGGMGLHNSSHNAMMPIGHQQSQQQQQHQSLQFSHFQGNSSLGLTVGSGRKSVSHLPPMRQNGSVDGSIMGVSGSGSSGSGGVMDHERLSNGYPSSGYASHLPPQQQQHQQHHHLGAIGDSGAPSGSGGPANNDSRDVAFSL
ncbi:Stress response protein nst1 [Mortierella alpina]|uniref:Stress response protein NST1 n=1 Tax=Mortierella alpina TaxID=64518 RepID=A0A9P6M5M3_MORAP|nr:Stress response protein nst1 [Mortierella alpina]